LGDSGGAQADALEADCGEGCQSIVIVGRECFEKNGPETSFDFECCVFGSPDVTLPGFVEHDCRGGWRGLVSECREQPESEADRDAESDGGDATLLRIHAVGLCVAGVVGWGCGQGLWAGVVSTRGLYQVSACGKTVIGLS
jgi:hypothetical protein